MGQICDGLRGLSRVLPVGTAFNLYCTVARVAVRTLRLLRAMPARLFGLILKFKRKMTRYFVVVECDDRCLHFPYEFYSPGGGGRQRTVHMPLPFALLAEFSFMSRLYAVDYSNLRADFSFI